jgi:hypothetical protein
MPGEILKRIQYLARFINDVNLYKAHQMTTNGISLGKKSGVGSLQDRAPG